MNTNIVTTDTTYVEIKNKGFEFINTLFKEKGWVMVKNDLDWIEYRKLYNELDYFQIKIDKTIINVSVPIKNTPYQYKTSFTNYYDANEYIEKRFNDFTV
jgi:hypothetical protein